jgi:small GTP-binding protein
MISKKDRFERLFSNNNTQKVVFGQTMSRRVDLSVKSVIIGDSGVGKTCFLTRFIQSTFNTASQPTLGVEFMSKILDTPKRRIELQLWDTAGQELFRSVTRGYYRNAAVAYVLFDLANQRSFSSLDRWIADLKDIAEKDLILVIIGTKSDLVESREVTRPDAESFAAANHAAYFETSACSGENVSEAIRSVLPILDDRAEKGRYASPSPSESLITSPEPSSGSCC